MHTEVLTVISVKFYKSTKRSKYYLVGTENKYCQDKVSVVPKNGLIRLSYVTGRELLFI